jgi:hypothetical protein
MSHQKTEAEQLREEGIELVLEAQHEEWKRQATETLNMLIEDGESFTADDFRKLAADFEIGEPKHPSAWSALIANASKAGRIEPAGVAGRSKRKASHGRLLIWWQPVREVA